MMEVTTDVIGMAGTVMVLWAYVTLQMGRIAAETVTYNIVNLIGASMILVSLMVNFNLASFVIEIFWVAASIFGLIRVNRLQRQS